MATVKQTKAIMQKIFFHFKHLNRALYQAHEMGVIQYDEYANESPCKSLYECETRLEKTTERALARAFRSMVRGHK
jgi:hypothetical protein